MKTQLILLVDETTPTATIKDQDLSGYDRVDLLYWGGFAEMLKEYKDLAGEKFFLHNVILNVEHHVNQFLDKKYDYCVVSQKIKDIEKLPKTIEKHNGAGGYLLFIRPEKDTYEG